MKYTVSYTTYDRGMDDTEKNNPTIWVKKFDTYEELQDFAYHCSTTMTREEKGYNRLEATHWYDSGLAMHGRLYLKRESDDDKD